MTKSPAEIPKLREVSTREGRHLCLQLNGPSGVGATALQYISRTNHLAVGFSDGYLQLWNMKTLKKEWVLVFLPTSIRRLCVKDVFILQVVVPTRVKTVRIACLAYIYIYLYLHLPFFHCLLQIPLTVRGWQGACICLHFPGARERPQELLLPLGDPVFAGSVSFAFNSALVYKQVFLRTASSQTVCVHLFVCVYFKFLFSSASFYSHTVRETWSPCACFSWPSVKESV